LSAGARRPGARAPLSDDEFARLIGALGPFEAAPEVAVGVSGGADSLCLARLAHRWARGRGGRAVGLVVDHRLRPGSAAEAEQACAWLREAGIEAHLLAWRGGKPATGVQEAAREARFRLLLGWCREAGVLHLLLAHQADDQVETHLMRAAAGSGPDGLAAMAAVVERRGVRLLRPLLTVPRARLRETLASEGRAWIDDPSNRDPAFTRARVRAALAADGCPPAVAARVHALGVARAAAEARVATLLARAVRLFPTGHAVIDAQALLGAPADDARRALARVLCCIGGAARPPRTARTSRLLEAIRTGTLKGGRTLGGCRILARRDGLLLVCREPAAIVPASAIVPGRTVAWDSRFAVAVPEPPSAPGPLSVRRLDGEAWRTLAEAAPALAAGLARAGAGAPPAAAVRAGLPALWNLDGPCALPHLDRWPAPASTGVPALFARFRPRTPLTTAPFLVTEARIAGLRGEKSATLVLPRGGLSGCEEPKT
jgi:tRNA(Ile)-lysidine synthase